MQRAALRTAALAAAMLTGFLVLSVESQQVLCPTDCKCSVQNTQGPTGASSPCWGQGAFVTVTYDLMSKGCCSQDAPVCNAANCSWSAEIKVTLPPGVLCDITVKQSGGTRLGGCIGCNQAYGVATDSTACGTQLTYLIVVGGTHVETVGLGCSGC